MFTDVTDSFMHPVFFFFFWKLQFKVQPQCKLKTKFLHYLTKSISIRTHISEYDKNMLPAFISQIFSSSKSNTRSDNTFNSRVICLYKSTSENTFYECNSDQVLMKHSLITEKSILQYSPYADSKIIPGSERGSLSP